MAMLRRVANKISSKSFIKTTSQVPFTSFHSNSGKFQEEEKAAATPTAAAAVAVPEESTFSKLGLDDWKISGPIGLAIAIPALNNGIYVLNEETQLACCFVLFCSSVYKFGGDMIGSYFDAKSDAILAEQNAVEDAAIAIAKETLETHKSQLGMVDDLYALKGAHEETVKLLCKTEGHRIRHEIRDLFVKNLESVIKFEKRYASSMQENMVEYASKKVRDVVESGSKEVKEAAFKNALAGLSQKSADETKEDPMVSLFCTHLRGYAESLEAQDGTTVKLSASEVSELKKELEGLLKRHDLHTDIEELKQEVVPPSEIKLSLLK